MNEKKHYIVTDFGDTYVGKKYERPVWSGFRIWESVKWPILLRTDFLKLKRTINTVGNPPLDILSDWIMDFSTISAGQLGRTDWENFRNLVLIHVPKCQSKCWYCFNDAWEDNEECKCEEISVEEVVKKFMQQHERNKEIRGMQNNVLRLSGGEPFTQPPLIKDLALEIARIKDNTIFFWLDTNLIEINNPKKEKEINEALEALSKLKNKLAIHACFHGISDESIKMTTGLSLKADDLILNYKRLNDLNLNVYPRFNPCACSPEEAEEFFIKLYEIDETAPLKLYLGIVELFYPVAKNRLEEVKALVEQGRRIKPIYHSPQAVIYWWDKIMQLAYGVGYGIIPRHVCNLLFKKRNPFLNLSSKKLKERIAEREDKPNEEILFLSKGSFTDIYAMKILEALARPNDSRIVIEYHKKYVEPNLYNFFDIFPEQYRDKDVLIVATHPKKRDIFHMAFLRWGKLKNIENTPVSTNVEVELGCYPYFKNQDEKLDGVENFEMIARYLGSRNLPVNGYFIQLMGFPKNRFPMITETTKVHQDEAFFQVVECLNEAGFKELNKNVYYRISSIKRSVDKSDISMTNGRLNFRPGDEIEIKLISCNPNLGNSGFPKEDEAVLSVSTTAKENVTIISQETIRMSKFGQHFIRLRLKEDDIEFKGELIIKSKGETSELRIFELTLPFNCEPEEI